jgi:hypothetical protein
MIINNEITFSTSRNAGERVDVEITAHQRTEPIPGPAGIHVAWDVYRGISEVYPKLASGRYEARQQFVVIFEGRESGGSGNVWYVCEASDVKENTKYLMGTGKTPKDAFDNFCERADVILSDDPAAKALVEGYGDAETIGNMKTQALRCFKKVD